MEKITEIIIDYVNNPRTTYAILINGYWGSGKTYFFNNEVTKEIEKIIKNEKPLNVLYISLNGINTLDDIYRQIAAEKYYTGTKTAKIGYGVVKSLANIVNINLVENFRIEDFISFSNTVLVFDDLERVSTEIAIADILGFINTNFVEHNKIKTIVIANEAEFKNKDEIEYYSQTKEKVIGRTLVYQPKLENIIPQIIQIFNSPDESDYYNFLYDNLDYIIELSKSFNISNLRTILFALEILGKIVESLTYAFLKLHSKKLILFTLTISKEFKNGALKSTDYKDNKGLEYIDKDYSMSYLAHSLSSEYKNDQNSEDIKYQSYAYNFFEQYLQTYISDYVFFKSIYCHILIGDLDLDLLKQEIGSIKEEVILPEYDIQQKIYKFRELSEEEFAELLPQFINNIEEGAYNLYLYPSLFSYVKFFSTNKLLSKTKDEIEKIFENGLANLNRNITASDYEYNRLKVFSSTDPEARQIEKKVIDIHNEIIKKKEVDRLEVLIKHIENGENIKEIFEEFNFKPIFDIIDIEKFYTSIINTDNRNRNELYQQFEIRYDSSNIGEFLDDDYAGLFELTQKLDKFIERENNTIRAFHVKLLIRKINEILIKIKKISR